MPIGHVPLRHLVLEAVPDADVSCVLKTHLCRSHRSFPLQSATMPRARKDADAPPSQRIARLMSGAVRSTPRPLTDPADEELYYDDLGVMWVSNPDNRLAGPYAMADSRTVSVDVSSAFSPHMSVRERHTLDSH